MASDPGRDSPSDMFDAKIIAEHSPQQSGGKAADVSPSQHSSDCHGQMPDVTQSCVHNEPSIELVGSEMYECEFQPEDALQGRTHSTVS